MKKLLLKCGISAIVLFGFSNSVMANEMTRVLFSSQGAGIRQQKPEVIRLAPGYGVNLSWLQTNETIKKVWLDNPSFVVLDADGCLEGLSNNCSGNANVLHLRRIERLNLPHIPRNNHSLLTVVTDAGFYLFKIIPSNTPDYLVYKVLPTPQPNDSSIFYTTLTKGIRVAKREGYLVSGSNLESKLNVLVRELQFGGDLQKIMQSQNISPEIITRLIELGGTENER